MNKLADVEISKILERITDGFFALDGEWKFIYINAECERLFNKKRGSLLGKNIWHEFPEIVDSIFYLRYNQAVAEQVSVNFESFYFPLKRWFEVRAYPSEDGLTVYLRDISDRKTIEENLKRQNEILEAQVEKRTIELENIVQALRQSQERLSAIFEEAPVGIIHTDNQGNILRANRKFSSITGYSQEELLANSFQDITHPDDMVRELLFVLQTLTGEISSYSLEQRYIRKDGSTVWINLTVAVIRDRAGNIVELVKVIEDISDRLQAEEALLKSEQRFRVIFSEAGVGISHTDISGRILRFNRKYCDIVDYLPDELVGLKFEQITHIEDLEEELLLQHQLLQGELRNYSIEKRYIRKDGSIVWVNVTVSVIHDDYGSPLELIKVVEDISDRKRAQEALRASEQALRTIFNSVHQAIFILGLDGTVLNVNNQMLSMFGVTRQQANLLPSLLDYSASNNSIESFCEIWVNVLAGENQLVEWKAKRPNDGLEFDAEVFFSKINLANQEVVLASIQDITKRKQAQEELRLSEAKCRITAQIVQEHATELEKTLKELADTQAQLIHTEKMSSLGELVAGIAHEINNPVNFIYGNIAPANDYAESLLNLISIYQENYPDPLPNIKEIIEEIDLGFIKSDLPKVLYSIKIGANRIRDIVISLRNFSRLDEAEMKKVDIHSGIESTLVILQNRLKSKPNHPEIEVIKEYSDLPLVECYPGQLNQVFMHILNNAIDAIDESLAFHQHLTSTYQGKIRISSHIVDDKQVKIRIADNGIGMIEEVRQKIFDPFFTTKPVGSGKGLGLSVSYQIVVKKHGGELECISHPKEGAELIITIPIKQ